MSTLTSSDDYWKAALDSLDPALQATISSTGGGRIDILASVLRTAERTRTICMKKRWKWKKPNGKTVIIRDMVEKFIKWVDKFKAIGDVAVGVDQVHAALPWAAARFLLDCACSEVKVFSTVAEGLLTVAEIITRYREFEGLYLGRMSPVKIQLEGALVRLYGAILESLSQTVRFFGDPTALRIIKSPFYLGEEHMRTVMEKEKVLLQLAGLVDANTLIGIHEMTTTLLASITLSTKRLERDRYEQTRRWLSKSNHSEHHTEIALRRLAGTGDWLPQLNEYRVWKYSSSSSLLLIYGVRGSGKSMLLSKVVDDLISDRRSNSPSKAFAYFYCSLSTAEPERARPENIIRNIIWQFATFATPESVRESVLDEFDSLRAVNVVRVLITSRDDAHILSVLQRCPKIRISAEDNREDMQTFISSEVSRIILQKRLLGGTAPTGLSEEIEKSLLRGAGEMFLWAKLQLDFLIRMKHEGDIRQAIRDNRSVSLDAFYMVTMRHVLDADTMTKSLAIRIFTWLLFAQEPLAPAVMLTLVSPTTVGTTTLTPERTTDICRNLVVVDPKRIPKRIWFIHQSVQEYLQGMDIFSQPVGHATLATSCLSVCSNGFLSGTHFDQEERPEQSVADDPIGENLELLRYCAIYWPFHLALARNTAQTLKEDNPYAQLKNFVFEEDSSGFDLNFVYVDWLEYVKQLTRSLDQIHPRYRELTALTSSDHSPKFLACVYGFREILHYLSSGTQNVIGIARIILVTRHFTWLVRKGT